MASAASSVVVSTSEEDGVECLTVVDEACDPGRFPSSDVSDTEVGAAPDDGKKGDGQAASRAPQCSDSSVSDGARINPVIGQHRYNSTRRLPPFEELKKEMEEQYNFPLVQVNGQRRCGPDPKWEGEPPSHGTEIFVGKIPRDVFEDTLMPIFVEAGRVYEMRLLMEYNGLNRGFAYVVYPSKAEAERAIRALHDYPIMPGRSLGVCLSLDNCRLFVGCIPKKCQAEDVRREMARHTEGVKRVILYANVLDKTKNRGFAFVEYDNHKAAALARRKMQTRKVTMWNNSNPLHVDWAEPEIAVSDEVMEKVRILYVRNLTYKTTEADIMTHFSQHGQVEKVKKMKDYAFVHFRDRDEAVVAMTKLDGTTLDEAHIEVTLARPARKEDVETLRAERAMRRQQQQQLQPRPMALFIPPGSTNYKMLVSPNQYQQQQQQQIAHGRSLSLGATTTMPMPPTRSYSAGAIAGLTQPPPLQPLITPTNFESVFPDGAATLGPGYEPQYAYAPSNMVANISPINPQGHFPHVGQVNAPAPVGPAPGAVPPFYPQQQQPMYPQPHEASTDNYRNLMEVCRGLGCTPPHFTLAKYITDEHGIKRYQYRCSIPQLRIYVSSNQLLPSDIEAREATAGDALQQMMCYGITTTAQATGLPPTHTTANNGYMATANSAAGLQPSMSGMTNPIPAMGTMSLNAPQQQQQQQQHEVVPTTEVHYPYQPQPPTNPAFVHSYRPMPLYNTAQQQQQQQQAPMLLQTTMHPMPLNGGVSMAVAGAPVVHTA